MKTTPCLLAALVLAATASTTTAATTFSFITDVWTNGSTTQKGYKDEATSGTLTKDGITMTFQNSYAGTAVASTRNLTLDFGNPTGFVLGTKNDANNLTGTLVNYQRWDFSFSQPVVLNSLGLDDVDSDKSNLSGTDGFRDAIAAEAFFTTAPGTIGTGLDAVFLFTPTTGLSGGTIATGGGQTIPYVISGPANNPNNDPAFRTFITFGDTPVTSFSIYSFSDRVNSHRVSLFQGVIEISQPAVPEPSTSLLGLLALPLMMKRRR